MDIEKLIEDLQWWAEHCDRTNYGCATRSILQNAATAPSTLQAENEKLRNEVERQRRSADDRKHLYENAERAYMKVLAELERVTAERDAAQSLLAERIGVRGAESITTAFGLPLARLRELAQAELKGKIQKYAIGDTIYDRFGKPWTVENVELHSLYTKNEWLYRCGHDGTDDYCALWEFEVFPSKEAALRREQDGE